MKNYLIVTDSCSDLPYKYAEEHQISVVPLTFIMNDKTYEDNLGQSMSYEEFFRLIDEGATPKTSQPTPEKFYQIFKKGVEEGNDILYIGVSKGMSGTFNSANLGKQMVLEEIPDANIVCFTTLNGSMGQSMFIQKAVEMKNEGKSLEDILSVLEAKLKTQKTSIIVNDLSYLKRGGRISGVQATVGSLLKVHPVLHVDEEGKVQVSEKIRGRKKAIRHQKDFVLKNIENPETQTLFICHSNSLDEAESLKEEILKEIPLKDVVINSIGPVVGSYSGTGSIAVFFLN